MTSKQYCFKINQTSSGDIFVSDRNGDRNQSKKSKKFKKANFYWQQHLKKVKDTNLKSKMDEFVTQGPNPLVHLFERIFDKRDMDVFKTEGISDIIKNVFSVPAKFNETLIGVQAAANSMQNVANVLSDVDDLPGGFTSISDAAKRFAEEGAQVNHIFKIEPMYEAIITLVVFLLVLSTYRHTK